MTPVEFQWAWGVIASRPSEHARQCYYFSAEDIYFATLPKICTYLVPFVDGELTDEAAHAFRGHLARCAGCQAELLAEMQAFVRIESALQKIGSDADPQVGWELNVFKRVNEQS